MIEYKKEFSDKILERFAALVAAAEREACAKVCESEWSTVSERDSPLPVAMTAAASRAEVAFLHQELQRTKGRNEND